jgi:hypothetical protein
MYFPESGIATAKKARKTENGRSTSPAVTSRPSIAEKWAASGVTKTLQE